MRGPFNLFVGADLYFAGTTPAMPSSDVASNFFFDDSYKQVSITIISATGAGSLSFGAGTLEMWVIGGGAAEGNDGVTKTWTGGGGAYSSTTHTLTGPTTAYYSNGAGATGVSGSNGSPGGDSWANIVSNAAPTLTSQGSLAKGGVNGTTSGAGAGGAAGSGVGTIKYSGGAGSAYDIALGPNSGGNYALPGGGGAAGYSGDGNDGRAYYGGSNKSPGGPGGYGAIVNSTLTADLVVATAGVQPGGAGGYGAISGVVNGAAGVVVFKFTAADPVTGGARFTTYILW